MKLKILFFMAFSLISIYSFAQIKQAIPEIYSLDVTDRLWVTVVPSDSNQIKIDGELADKVEMVISGSSLRLKMKAGFLMKGNQTQVIVYAAGINKLVARKGAELYVEKEELQGDSLQISAFEGAKVRAKLAANEVDVTLNTGATADLLGTAQAVRVNSSAGSTLFAKDLMSKEVYVRVNAGGKAEVSASESADVETRAGGTIEVYGKPASTKQRKIAGGKIIIH